MFNKVLSDVTYADVLAFCQTYPEGVRAEYKREAAHIAKVISSFANTVGGIWVIGVDTDKANRAILPPVGLPLTPGIEEKIVQSAQAGVYPPITPAVRVFDMPDKPDHVLVVVKVPESVDAPHAVENSTRVHIRVENTTDTIQLSDIDRIAYLLKRRQAPEEWRDTLITHAIEASPLTYMYPRLMRTVIAPLFPRGTLFSYDTLFERATRLDQAGHRVLRNFRMVHEGIMAGRVTDGTQPYHLEVSTHGIMLFEEIVEPTGEVDQIPFFLLIDLLRPVVRALDTAVPLFDGAITNLLIRCQLLHCHNVAYLDREPGRLARAEQVAAERRCVDQVIQVWTTTTAETLAARRVELLTILLQPMLWAFSYRATHLKQDVELLVTDRQWA